MKKLGALMLAVCLSFGLVGQAQAAKYELKIQTALANSSVFFKTMERMKTNIETLSNGEISVELLAAGAIVKANEILDAVNENLINGGMWWTHYASGKNPAGTLFSAPCGGLGFGLDQMSVLSWGWEGDGGKLLNEYYQDACKANVVAWMAQPHGPEAFGWFHERYNSVLDLNKLTFRAPPGVPAEIFTEMGMPVVALAAPDIIPAAQRGAIDAAEWINPAEDIAMGFDQIWKHLYLQGLHQGISIGDIFVNKTWFESLPKNLQAVIEISMKTCCFDQLMSNIKANSEALQELVTKRGVVIEETPADYYPAFMKAARTVFDSYAKKDAFFKKVYDNEVAWAKLTVPFQMRANGLYYNLAKAAMDDGLVTDYIQGK